MHVCESYIQVHKAMRRMVQAERGSFTPFRHTCDSSALCRLGRWHICMRLSIGMVPFSASILLYLLAHCWALIRRNLKWYTKRWPMLNLPLLLVAG